MDHTPSAATVGPPVKFDAEPKRKKSYRGLYVILAVFLLILAIGFAGYSHLQKFKEERRAARETPKETAESKSVFRTPRIFDTIEIRSPDLPDQTGQERDPGPVIQPDVPALQPQGGRGTTAGGMPEAAKKPRRSMVVTPVEWTASDEGQEEVDNDAPLQQLKNVLPKVTGASPRPQAGPKVTTVQQQAQAASGAPTKTGQRSAAKLGNRSYVLARGTAIPCALYYALSSNVPGQSKCTVTEDVYSDDGKVKLVDKGSTVDGQYGSTMKTGDSRIAVVWDRIKTTNGTVIDVDSPAGDGMGTAGIDGYVDNHWMQRIGAAVMLSLVDDAIQVQTAKQGAQATSAMGSNQPYQATTSATKSIAEKVLESTINIPPTISKQKGARIMVMVRHDLWFDNVYGGQNQ